MTTVLAVPARWTADDIPDQTGRTVIVTGANSGLGYVTARELARQRTRGRARSGLGAGVDQVGHGLGLRQVELAVEERARRELAGLGRSQRAQVFASGGSRGSGFEAAHHQKLQHHGATVRVQLEHVLAGVRVRRGKVQRQALVDRPRLRIEERQQRRVARQQRPAADRQDQRLQPAARHPHDADRSAAGCGGDGDDGIIQPRQHRRPLWRADAGSMAGALHKEERARGWRARSSHWRGEERRAIHEKRSRHAPEPGSPGRPRMDRNGPLSGPLNSVPDRRLSLDLWGQS